MLQKHEALAGKLAEAEAQAIEIANAGADVQGIINTIREAATLTRLRLANYRDAAPAAKPAQKTA